MQIRRLTEKDIEQAIALEHACDERAPKTQERWMYWFIKFDQEQAYGYFNHNQLIGLIYRMNISNDKNDPIYGNGHIMMHPSFQAKGHGKHLLESMLAVVDTLSPDRPSTLKVLYNSANAIGLYEKYGYKTISSNDGMHTMSREPFAHITDSKADTLDHAPAQG